MYISDENMQLLTDIIGNTYMKWVDLFETDKKYSNSYNQHYTRLEDFLNNRRLIYSVVGDMDCAVSEKDDRTVTVASGYVVNGSNEIVRVTEHDVTIDYSFNYDYPATGHYGIYIGFYNDDIDAVSSIQTSELLTSLTTESTLIEVRDSTIVSASILPAIVNIDGEEILVDDISAGKFVISDAYNGGHPVSAHTAGARLFLHKTLRASLKIGVPVDTEYQSGPDVNNFKYMPLAPINMTILAKILVENPLTPYKIEHSINDANILSISDQRYIGDSSGEDPFTSEEQITLAELLTRLDDSKNVISYNDTFTDIVDSLSKTNFYEYGETEDEAISFEDYWNNRPVQRANSFKYGSEWGDLEIFEFCEGFKRLYYNSQDTELLTVYGLFAGELTDSVYFSASSVPEINTDLSDYETGTGGISPGTWTYGVSAITSDGESPVSTYYSINIPITSLDNKIILYWELVDGADYYHVYRKNSNNIIKNDLRLTDDNEVNEENNKVTIDDVDYIMFEDDGSYVGETTRRGFILTNNETLIENGINFYAYVPLISDTGSLFPITYLEDSIENAVFADEEPSSRTTQNEIIIDLTFKKSDGNYAEETVTIAKGTLAGTKILISDELYVSLYDASFRLPADPTKYSLIGSRVDWSLQDIVLITN
jgi:hypothetical protein